MKQLLGGWMYRIVTTRRRWTALAAAAVFLALSVIFLTRSTDYRDDPSALVPRSADMYAETTELPNFLKTAGAWKLWRPEKRGAADGETAGDLEKELASLVASRVGGLPVAEVLRWMASADGAAWCVSLNGDAPESWALYLRLPDPASALKEIELEPGMAFETVRGGREGDGVFSLSGNAGNAGAAGGVFFGVVEPWLIFSGDAKLPEFALEAKNRPGVSLAGSDILPDYRRGASVRGVFNPVRAAALTRVFGVEFVEDWLSPRARVAYTALMGRSGGMETRLSVTELSEEAPGSGLWPIAYIIVCVIALFCAVVILGILASMLGCGAWFKAAAARAGIEAAKEPVAVEPSEAFLEDAKAEETKEPEATAEAAGADTPKANE